MCPSGSAGNLVASDSAIAIRSGSSVIIAHCDLMMSRSRSGVDGASRIARAIIAEASPAPDSSSHRAAYSAAIAKVESSFSASAKSERASRASPLSKSARNPASKKRLAAVEAAVTRSGEDAEDASGGCA